MQGDKWRKFNDVTVSDVSYEDLYQESAGGHKSVNAYSLIYVDASRKDLFTVDNLDRETLYSESLTEYLQKDNEAFQRELLDWKMKEKKAGGNHVF